MRFPRALPALLILALTACDAGHRENPGVDNKSPGPELLVVQPGPGQVVTLPVKSDGPARYRMPKAFFDLRNLAREADRKGDVIQYRVNGGPLREVRDWSRPVTIDEEAHKPGTHVLQACVWNEATGAPYTNPESVVLRVFHLAAEDGNWDLWMTEGDPPRAPLLESGPALLVTGPAARVKGTPRLTFAFKGKGFGTRYRLAYLVDGGQQWQHATTVGPIALEGLAPGKHSVLVRLEEQTGKDTWTLAPRPFFARRAADDAAMPGEFNVMRVEFELAP